MSNAILTALAAAPNSTLLELAAALEADRFAVARALLALVEAGTVTRAAGGVYAVA